MKLELSEEQFREMVERATREIVRHIGSLPTQPMHATRERLEWFMAAGEAAGHRLTPWHFMALRPIYVAPTDEQAFEEGEAAFTYFAIMFRNHAIPPDLSQLPDAYAYHREMFSHFTEAPASYAELIEAGIVVCGSPDTVKEQLREQQRVIGNGNFVLLFNYGNLTHEQVTRSLTLFAEQVMPDLRGVPVAAMA